MLRGAIPAIRLSGEEGRREVPRLWRLSKYLERAGVFPSPRLPESLYRTCFGHSSSEVLGLWEGYSGGHKADLEQAPAPRDHE